jgi:protein required for attachment to host cells
MKQEQKDALLQDLQVKLQKADKLLEQSHDAERFGGIGKYKQLIVIAAPILLFCNSRIE